MSNISLKGVIRFIYPSHNWVWVCNYRYYKPVNNKLNSITRYYKCLDCGIKTRLFIAKNNEYILLNLKTDKFVPYHSYKLSKKYYVGVYGPLKSCREEIMMKACL